MPVNSPITPISLGGAIVGSEFKALYVASGSSGNGIIFNGPASNALNLTMFSQATVDFQPGFANHLALTADSGDANLTITGNFSASGDIKTTGLDVIQTGNFNKVGIGISPANNVELDVRGDALITGKQIYFAHDGGTNINNDYISFSDTTWQTAGGVLSLHADQARGVASGSVDMALFTEGIYSSGNVGIGTHQPTEKLEVDGNILLSGNITGETVSGSLLRSSGDLVAYYTSDKRLKDNITTIESPLEKINKLKGVSYEWNDKQDIYPVGQKDSGIIAQDVEAVLPELVQQNPNGYLGVKHDRLVGLLIEAIKEQQKQIDSLKLKLNNKGDD